MRRAAREPAAGGSLPNAGEAIEDAGGGGAGIASVEWSCVRRIRFR